MDITKVYEKYWYPLYCFSKKIVGSKCDAEDIVSDFFYSVIKHPERLQIIESFEKYMWWQVKMKCVDFITKTTKDGKKEREYGYTLTEEDISNFEEYKDQGEMLKKIEEEINHLPKKEGAIFKMSHVYGFATGKIMAITGISHQSIRNSNHRAMVKIRVAMTPKTIL